MYLSIHAGCVLNLTSCSAPKGPGYCSAPQALSIPWLRGLWQCGERKKGREEKGPTAVLCASSRRTCARNTLKEMPKGHKCSWMSNKCTCKKLKSRWKAGRRTYNPKWEPQDVSLQILDNLHEVCGEGQGERALAASQHMFHTAKLPTRNGCSVYYTVSYHFTWEVMRLI